MICHQVTLSGDAEWPKVADAVIEALAGLDHRIGHPSWPASPGKKAAVTESHSS